jgi:toxin CcdB
VAQFDVYENMNMNTKDEVPYLLDIQNDILKELATRVVVPLALNKKSVNIINPQFKIENQNVVMLTTQLAGIPLYSLGIKICSLNKYRSDIIGAIDFMVTGF